MVETTVTVQPKLLYLGGNWQLIFCQKSPDSKGSFLTFKTDIKNGKDFLNGLSSFAQMLL